MKQPIDTWYVRFPDGRVLRASNTQVLRQQLGSGLIPFACRVRRSGDEEWMALDWTQEFADLVKATASPRPAPARRNGPIEMLHPGEPANLATRLDPLRLKTVGLRGLLEELVAALDNTLARSKLAVAGCVGVAAGLLAAFAGSLSGYLPQPWALGMWVGLGLVLLVIGSVGNILLTQMTYVELCRLRPARWSEARGGLVRYSMRLFTAMMVFAGGTGLAIWLVRQFPGELAAVLEAQDLKTVGALTMPAATVLAMLVEIVLWPVLGFTLLLGPVVVIEEGSIFGAVRQWWGVVRRHWGRLILYQFAAALAGVTTLVFAAPLALVAWGRLGQWGSFDNAVGFTLCVLAGLAAAPLIAYSAVAHVFLYINLRYEVEQGA